MAVAYKENMTKEELLEIAVSSGISADNSMTKKEILSMLESHNAKQEAKGETQAQQKEDSHEKPDTPQGYDLFVYAGPTLPRGRLKENAVFRGTLEDVKGYLSDVLEDYPQVEKLIVPAGQLAAFSAKVKTPGNIAHKYYTDLISAARKGKEEF